MSAHSELIQQQILKIFNILLLMAQFHNAPSNFADFASGETGIGY